DGLTGSDVPNILDGGDGDDVFNARGGGIDRIECGLGANDWARVDALDVVENCERVETTDPNDRPPRLTFPVSRPQPAAPAPAPVCRVWLASRKPPKLGVALKKGLPVTATCSLRCRLRGQLKVDAKTARKLGLKKAVIIASGTASAGNKI